MKNERRCLCVCERERGGGGVREKDLREIERIVLSLTKLKK